MYAIRALRFPLVLLSTVLPGSPSTPPTPAGVDDVETAELFNPTGVSGVMVDHWTILQFLLTGE